MFARVKESRNEEYLQIVENYRDAGRVRQRMVMYVGHYDSIDQALEVMPQKVATARRHATAKENAYEAVRGYQNDWTHRLRQRSVLARSEATALASKLDSLRRLVEGHPDLLPRDRARAERHRKRKAKTVSDRLAALRVSRGR